MLSFSGHKNLEGVFRIIVYDSFQVIFNSFHCLLAVSLCVCNSSTRHQVYQNSYTVREHDLLQLVSIYSLPGYHLKPTSVIYKNPSS